MLFLMDGELVARVDLKAERDRVVLRVSGPSLRRAPAGPKVVGKLADELNLVDGGNWSLCPNSRACCILLVSTP